MWEWIRVFSLAIFLAWQAIEDFRKKSIRMDIVLFFGILGICVCFISKGVQIDTLKEVLLSCVPGVILLIVSHICPKMIGDGDGIVFLITGIYMGLGKNGLLIYISFLLVSMFGLMMILMPQKKKTKSYPFVPFIFSAFVMIELLGMRV